MDYPSVGRVGRVCRRCSRTCPGLPSQRPRVESAGSRALSVTADTDPLPEAQPEAEAEPDPFSAGAIRDSVAVAAGTAAMPSWPIKH